jgi:hypothetical protein
MARIQHLAIASQDLEKQKRSSFPVSALRPTRLGDRRPGM